MAEPVPEAEQRLFGEYPALSNFFDTVVWPRGDGDNVFELVHRVMRHWHPDFVKQLVRDLETISGDGLFSSEDLAGFFNRSLPTDWQLVDADNCRTFLRTLSGYAGYLYREDGVRGTTD
jgi:hypothetical protein